MSKFHSVVTGGAGFIGSHLVDRLLAEGHQVTVIDNLSTGRLENLAHLKQIQNTPLSFIQADLNNPQEYAGKLGMVDFVFHLAALADIVPSIQRPVEYYRANVDGTLALLEVCRPLKLRKLVYAASSSCYGIPDKYPTPETATIRPQYPYALTKWLAEETIFHWGKVYGMPVVATRFFNAYGPRSRTHGTYGAVFGVFLGQMLAGKPLTIVGDGTQTRDFTYVTDVADAVYTAALSDVTGESFNVGSGGTYSVNELVKLLGASNIQYIPKRPGEPDCTFADITKIQSMLKWRPKTSFPQGVQEVLKNIDYWRSAPVWTTESIAEATKDWFTYLGRNTTR